MTENEFFSGDELLQHVELKVKSLMIIISEIKQSSLNYEFDPSIRNDINEYIQIVETDCQTIINDIKNNLFSNKMYHKTQNIYDDKILLPPMWMINNEDYYKQKMQKFEVEINSKVDDVTKSIGSTTDILNAYYKENLAYLKNIESEIKEKEKKIIIKRQKIDEENIKIKKLEEICVDKNKIILGAQIEIKKKQSQLENIEQKYKKESIELENKRLEHQKKRTNFEIMNSIIKYHNEETKEKIQFYNDNIIRPLEFKLEKCISLVDYEKNKIDNINTSVIEFSPEFKEKIEDAKSEIEQLDKTISVQYGTVASLEEDYKTIQLNVIRQTEINSIKAKKFIDNFGAISNYWMKMLNVLEMREKNKLLDSKVFQKRYEIKKKREECLKREKGLMSQLDELKELVRQQVTYNKRLSQQYNQLINK
ncbi:repetitive organellar protein-like [Metopolophium dirhodum]|uniref:repetitive organellar protein-like n=1 Tax=Metopolophium dirhodum TaxID=44670 RepID=UPI00298F468B|nr:repetitive organellar protein-like [Metopolophium dirhodum]